MWTDFDGKPYTRASFLALLDNIPTARLRWCKFLCVHNTAAPSITQWSSGAATPAQRIVNLQHFYENERGWHAGPHGFVPPDPNICLYGFSSFMAPGVHASCFNKVAIGLELVGDFDSEDFNSGPGAIVRDNAIFVLAALHNRLGLRPDEFELGKSGLHFHVDCKRDNHACPGRKVQREPLVQAVLEEMERLKAHGQRGAPLIAAPHDPSAPIAGAVSGASAGAAAAQAPASVMAAMDAPPAKSGIWERFNFNLVNDFAEQGSRLAGSLRTIKATLHGLMWGPPALSGGAVKVANTGTGQIAAAHPNILLMVIGIGVGISLAAGIVYLIIKFAVEPHFVSAAKDKRYAPRGAVGAPA